MTFDTLQKFNREEANPFEVVHTTATNYTASANELVITEGDSVELPAPTENAIVGVRDNGQQAFVTSPSGQVHLLNEAYFNAEETVYFVSDGTDWYSISDTQWFGPEIPDSEVDYFEDGDISEYSGNTGSFSVTDGSSDGLTTPREGPQMLREYISSGSATIYSTSGLPNYPSAGNKFRCWVYFGAQSGFASSGEIIRTHFGVQSSTSSSYAIVLSPSGDYVEIWKDGSAIASTNATIDGETWYDQRCDWKSDTISIDILDVNENTVASVSATDSTYSSGGVGFGHNAGGNSGYWDGFATD